MKHVRYDDHGWRDHEHDRGHDRAHDHDDCVHDRDCGHDRDVHVCDRYDHDCAHACVYRDFTHLLRIPKCRLLQSENDYVHERSIVLIC